MSVVVQIEKFEGPLGLLLHLIRREEMDIFDINIHAITSQYLDYIKNMKRLNLEAAGEFVAMAATLIHIKSRMLLPQYDGDGEPEEVQDPRRELVQRLLEYEKFQDVAKKLGARPLLGRDVWARGLRETFEVTDDQVLLEENPLFGLISTYRFVVRNMKKAVHRVGQTLQSIGERVFEMRHRLIVGRQVRFADLLQAKPGEEGFSGQVLMTFLSLLELAKLGFVGLFQNDISSEIHVETKRPIEGDVLTRVEDYEHTKDDDLFMDELVAESSVLEVPEHYPDDDVLMETAESDPSVRRAEVPVPPEPQAATDEEILAEEERLFGNASGSAEES